MPRATRDQREGDHWRASRAETKAANGPRSRAQTDDPGPKRRRTGTRPPDRMRMCVCAISRTSPRRFGAMRTACRPRSESLLSGLSCARRRLLAGGAHGDPRMTS
jgi:hypothetical protein